MQYINSNDILYDKQFGFRKGHSTSHAIITLVEKESKALDTGKIVVGVYLEILKAFDCVRHSTLLDKFHKIGIRGNLFCLIKSYLMSRTQYVPIAFFYTFADDTSVFLIGKEYTQLIVSVNKELKKVSHLLNANRLTINVKRLTLWCFTEPE